MGQRPTSPSQGQPGALTRGGAQPGCGGRSHGVARRAMRARTATASGGGARRHDEAEPKRGRGGTHGDAEVAASLTGGDAGEERRRGGGAMARARRLRAEALAGGLAGRGRKPS